MFGLTFEKLFLVTLVAGFVIGPHRLPACAQQLRDLIHGVRGYLDTARASALRAEWEALDVGQYDPRRIAREAFAPPGAEEAPRTQYLVSGTAAHPRVRINKQP
ncbi:Sec-independent protein translocase subunit TatA/TatB [Nocardioides sp. GXZ039]|uniref:Sec-independent protein translocase subunit TatA/TatB n=1 Tax=Nocardioides sp. GXZ039 TaxID=3136018 RepID=UPI0030F4514B